MKKDAKIYVAGHEGMVGSAIWRELQKEGYTNLIGLGSKLLDLRVQNDVNSFFEREKPEYVFLSAGKVGGIHANNIFRAEFLYDNIMISTNLIHASYLYQVKKLLFLGSSCIYPKQAIQPMKEDALLSGYLEPTNEPYAIAKICGIKLCENYRRQYGSDFISVMPTNLYGPMDKYDLSNSHVIPALIRKFHEAKINQSAEITMWGTGSPLREFMYVDDLASALILLMKNYSEEQFINIGTGEEISIIELAKIIKEVVGYNGKIVKDISKPDGTPRKLMDSSKLLSLGWTPKISLREGLMYTYENFKTNYTPLTS